MENIKISRYRTGFIPKLLLLSTVIYNFLSQKIILMRSWMEPFTFTKDGKRTYRHTFIIPFLIWFLNVILCMSKMSKIEGCNAMYSKMGKEHTHTSLTCFDIHRIWWYGWKALSLSFHIPCTVLNIISKIRFAYFTISIIRNDVFSFLTICSKLITTCGTF